MRLIYVHTRSCKHVQSSIFSLSLLHTHTHTHTHTNTHTHKHTHNIHMHKHTHNIHVAGKTNFFEKRVGEYQKSGVMTSTQV
jgi:hypothetical protein